MSERQLQFRIGLLTIFSLGIGAWLVVQFGELRELWQPVYAVDVAFDRAPGVFEGTPVRSNGVKIGSVKVVNLAETGVLITLEIETKYPLHADAEVTLTRGLLGDASVNVLPGRSPEPLAANTPIVAKPYLDPMEAVQRMEANVSVALASFQSTSEEWRTVGTNLNSLMETNRGDLDLVVERTAESLHEFTVAMRSFSASAQQAQAVLGDPKNQENLRKTLEAVPLLVEDTRAAIVAVRTAVQKADESLANLAETTGPLADRSASIVTRLDGTLANLESLSGELNDFARLANREDGTLKSLASDASLYRNLDRSAESMTVLLANLEPILRDLRVFSDKIARRPELMGVGGALAPSDGAKTVVPASHQRPVGSARVGDGARR